MFGRRLLAASVAVALAGCAAASDDTIRLTASDRTAVEPAPSTVARTGAKLPDVELVDEQGERVSTAALLGDTPLVINYWFSTCRPCRDELPDFAAVDAEMAGKVRFIGVNGFDTPTENVDFARRLGVEYDLFLDPDGEYTKALRLTTAPATLFVTADGTVVKQVGQIRADELRATIVDLLLTS